MKYLKLVPLILIYTKVEMVCGLDYFGYTSREQSLWPKHFRKCGGSRQSPILINKDKVKISPTLPLTFNGYNTTLPVLQLQNNGHTVDLSINPNYSKNNVEIPSITGGILKNKYQFQGLHLHWGKINDVGSEHIIEEIKTPLELHIVHKRISKHFDPSDTYVVLAILYTLQKKAGIELNSIFNNLLRVQNINATVPVITSFHLNSFLSKIDTGKFYSYKGSLTTPPCLESVTWIIFYDTLTCSPAQLKKLRKLRKLDKEGRINRILENHRFTQPINNRTVNLFIERETNLLDIR